MATLQHSPIYEKWVKVVKEQQRLIVARLEEIDGTKFRVDEWTKPNDGGHGISCVIEDGNVFERGGVMVSVVQGTMTGAAAVAQMRASHPASIPEGIEALPFSAVGLSLTHAPEKPHGAHGAHELPLLLVRRRADLTPCYLYDEDAAHFHTRLRAVCDRYDAAYYPRFKSWCDKYFWNAHRGEARGVGGIFFDDLEASETSKLESLFGFARDVLQIFPEAYVPIVEKRRGEPFTEAQKEWQQLRRGRYVEFNLLHDRGTKFGLAGSSHAWRVSWSPCRSRPLGSTTMSPRQTVASSN
ncbi:hypothetical protein G7054_g1194 [Neopestalotiopsis clavispora]|nr:hypothetical protein G7054_g1194 [Neopestalotiopsis clavispora]